MFKNTLYFDVSDTPKIEELWNKISVEKTSKAVGYYNLPAEGEKLLLDIGVWGAGIRNVENIVVIGVGGSSLGTKALYSMLYHEKKASTPNLYFLENIDSVTIKKTLKSIKLDNSLFLLVSKSGTTLDTISIAKIVMVHFGIFPGDKYFGKYFAVVTDSGSALNKFANEYGLKSFFIPKNVGGRFSVLSATGVVPLTLCGIDTAKLLQGAAECQDDFFSRKISDTLIKKSLAYTVKSGQNINVLFSYSDIFRDFNAWYVQLWAESLGKKKGDERVGLTPVGLIGAIDQHSFLQLIIDGPKDKSVTFIRVENMTEDMPIPDISLKFLEKTNLKKGIGAGQLLNEQAIATMKSVLNEGAITDEIVLAKADAFHAGYLIYYFELLTSLCGLALEINAYNQPGVEVGKKILLDKLGK
ncbi:MAG: glucose-6-phosphate isomerase [Campylobacteraceae bacterium]|nr:glucose-6-phosphate isomerase [Campylobacteraceae bacterium]